MLIDDKLLPKIPKKRIDPVDPPIEVKESTLKSFSEEKLMSEVKKIYSMAKDIMEGNPDSLEFIKQRLVDAALGQLNYDNHMVVMVGTDMQTSWAGRGNSRMKRAAKPTNNKAENYATEVESIDFKVIY